MITRFGYPTGRAKATIADLPRDQWPIIWLVRLTFAPRGLAQGDLWFEAEGAIKGWQRTFLLDTAFRVDRIEWGGIMTQPIEESFLAIPIRDELIPGPSWDDWREEDHPHFEAFETFMDDVENSPFEEDDRWFLPVKQFLGMKPLLKDQARGDAQRSFLWSGKQWFDEQIRLLPSVDRDFDLSIEDIFESQVDSENSNPTWWG